MAMLPYITKPVGIRPMELNYLLTIESGSEISDFVLSQIGMDNLKYAIEEAERTLELSSLIVLDASRNRREHGKVRR